MLQEIFAYVRPACDFAGVLSDEASVGVIDGRMEAYNKHLIISQPCDLPNFAVSPKDLDFALRNVVDPEVKVTDVNVILSGGGKTRIKRLIDRQKIKKPDIETRPIEKLADLLDVIDDVFPFTSGDPARPWSEGARFDDGTVTATNSVMLCQAQLTSSSGLDGFTVSRAALGYMRLRRAALKSWGLGKRGLLLECNDDSWCLVSRMAMEMPVQAVSLVNAVDSWEDLQEVDDAYRGAFLRAGDWADEVITIHPDKVSCGRLSSEHDEYAKTKIGDDPGVFEAKALVSVIVNAAKIGFDRYPAPVPFVTKLGSRGIIAGRTS